MEEIIERLKQCVKKNTPILIKPQQAQEILFKLGYRI
jgi:hypothetical protein